MLLRYETHAQEAPPLLVRVAELELVSIMPPSHLTGVDARIRISVPHSGRDLNGGKPRQLTLVAPSMHKTVRGSALVRITWSRAGGSLGMLARSKC